MNQSRALWNSPCNTERGRANHGCTARWLIPWSTVRSLRVGTPIYCLLKRMWSSVNTPFPPGIEPSITLIPLRHASFTRLVFWPDRCVMYTNFYLLQVLYLYPLSSVLVICHFNIYLTEMGVMHRTEYILLYLDHLVPLPIWIMTSCPFFINWEVLLANAR